MVASANPIQREGSKNIYCPHYEDCLDFAVEKIWQAWDCCECPHKNAKQRISELLYTVDDEVVIFELPSGFSEAAN